MVPAGIFLLGCVAAGGLYLIRSPDKKFNNSAVSCRSEGRTEDFECWRVYFEARVQSGQTKQAFADAKKSYDEVQYVKTNCHQLAHVIGRAAGKKYGDVSKAFAEGDNWCWSGYYHGVMESIAGELGVDKVLADINSICQGVRLEREYSFFHYNCVHGLGHGIMAVLDNKLFESLESCTKLDGNWQQESCYGGAFMENVMNEINSGHKSAHLKIDDPLYPCTVVAEKFKQQCYLMQTSHVLIVAGQDYSKVFSLCSSVEQPYDATCFQSLGRDASGSTSSDVSRTKDLCETGSTDHAITNCYIGAVKDFISYFHDDSQAKILCQSAGMESIREICFQIATEYHKSF